MASCRPSYLVVLVAAVCVLLTATEAGRPDPGDDLSVGILPPPSNPWSPGCNAFNRCRRGPPPSDLDTDSDRAAGSDSGEIRPGTMTSFPSPRALPINQRSSVGTSGEIVDAASEVLTPADAEVGVNAGATLPPPSNPWHRGCNPINRCRGEPPASDVDADSDKAGQVDAGGLRKPVEVGKF